jgi:hypothetical protein
MVRPVSVTVAAAVALAALALDRLIASHPVVFQGSSPEVLGEDVLDPRGALLVKESFTVSVAVPMVCAGVIVAGAYVALHMIGHAARVLYRKWLPRGARPMWWNGSRPIRRFVEAIVQPTGTFLPNTDLDRLIAACVLTSAGMSCVAAWVLTSMPKASGASRSGGVSRTRLRMVAASVLTVCGVAASA